MKTHVQFYQEPGNLLLCRVIQSGELHKLVGGFGNDLEGASLALCAVLSHLFSRRYLPTATLRTDEAVKKSPSKVFLDPLPSAIDGIFREHDKQVLNLFTTYALSYAKMKGDALPREDALPLSNLTVVKKHDVSDHIVRALGGSAVPCEVRSAFAALCGKGDHFSSVAEIAATCRNGIHVRICLSVYVCECGSEFFYAS